MIPKPDIIGQTIISILEGPSPPAGVSLDEFGEAHWTEFILHLENGLLLHLHEYSLTPYQKELTGFTPATLEQATYGSTHPRSHPRSAIEGRKITHVAGEPDDQIYIFLDSGLGIGTFAAPGGNMLSFRDSPTSDMIDYWTQQPHAPPHPTP